jgi:hypothetical protein
MITISARLVWLIMQCSLLFHFLAQLLECRRIGFLHKHVTVLLLQKRHASQRESPLHSHVFFIMGLEPPLQVGLLVGRGGMGILGRVQTRV